MLHYRGLASMSSGNHRDVQQRIYKFGWSGSPPTSGTSGIGALKFEVMSRKPDLHRFGKGCKGSNGVPALSFTGSAKLAASLTIDVKNCVANAVSLHVVGLTRYSSGIDLGFAGAPSCLLYQSPDVIIGQVANASGAYTMKVTVPNDKNLICARIYTQAFPADKTANNWGRTASNYGRILPGL